jgi:hypothetical protein
MPIQSRIWLAVDGSSSMFLGLNARDRQVGRHELGHREDGRVEVGDERAQEAPGVGVGLGGVDVTAPHRARRPCAVQAQQRGRLRVVDHDEVVSVVELQRVFASAPQIRVLLGRREGLRRALQRVVQGLRRAEELGAAAQHLPVGVQAEVAQQGDRGAQQLGDAAAIGGRVDVQDARAAQRPRLLAQRLEDRPRDDLLIGLQRPPADRDGLEHRSGSRQVERGSHDGFDRRANHGARIEAMIPRAIRGFPRDRACIATGDPAQ